MDISTASPLCDQCWHIFEMIEATRKKSEHTRHIANFETPSQRHAANFEVPWERPVADFVTPWHRSLDSECAFCSVRPLNDPGDVHYEVSGLSYEVSGASSEQYTLLKFSSSERTTSRPEFEFSVCRVQEDDPLFTICQKASLEDYTGNDSVLEIASRWMSRCISHHGMCVKNEEPQEYPTRLLKIYTDTIRLMERGQSQFRGPYATLSYSWGKANLKMLTEQTLLEFRSGIRIQELPCTFRDAVAVAVKLGISYLWIDCYCILQDENDEDKRQEIAKMEGVNSGAILNIGAAWASSPMGGLFTHRAPKVIEPTLFTHRIPVTKPNQITWDSRSTWGSRSYLVYSRREHGLGDDERFSSPQESTIFSRAWCLQERFLCPRMLHFCAPGLYWECETIEAASDVLPFSLPPSFGQDNPPPFSIRENDTGGWSLPPDRQWDRIMSVYSEMGLSHPTEDKLVACGGVAKHMAKRLNDDYAAGFFRRDIIQRLAWTKEHNLNTPESLVPRRAEQWRAPSWSWASMDGKIWEADLLGRVEICQITALDCILADPSNPYGALVSAMIKLKGWVAGVKLVRYTEPSMGVVRLGLTHVKVYFDDVNESKQDLIILLTTTLAETGDILSRQVDGLVLAPIDEDIPSETKLYRRVGCFQRQQATQASERLKAPDKIKYPFAERVISVI